MLTLEQVEAAGGYTVILADPPWRFNKGSVDPGRSIEENHYKTMTLPEICALPVERLAAKDAALFLWGCWALLPEALCVIKAWGFEYKSCAFDWIKLYPSGEPVLGLGRWTRGSSEPCLLGIRGKPKRASGGVLQALEEGVLGALRGEHSAKPDSVRERIEELMGDVPRIELFARTRAKGWDAIGDQVPGGSDVELCAL